MKNLAKNSALLIIDMQNDFVLTEKTAVKGAKATILAIKHAMDICREKNIPVFHIIRAYDANGDNAEIFRKELFQKGQGFCRKNELIMSLLRELSIRIVFGQQLWTGFAMIFM